MFINCLSCIFSIESLKRDEQFQSDDKLNSYLMYTSKNDRNITDFGKFIIFNES